MIANPSIIGQLGFWGNLKLCKYGSGLKQAWSGADASFIGVPNPRS